MSIKDLDDFFNTDEDDYYNDFPEVGIHRLKGKESVSIDGKMYWAPEALLDEFERLNATIEKMQHDTIIMSAIFNSGMTKDEKDALTYEKGPYDVTFLTCGIRNFVNTLIAKAGEQHAK